MTLYHAFDASTPPTKPFPGSQIVCGYIGGDTPHVWTADEWNAASNHGALHMLPIYVVSDPKAVDHLTAAKEAANRAHALGWTRHIGRIIALDSETSDNAAFISQFAHELAREGFATLDYRSISILNSHPSGLSEWAADYSLPPLPSSHRQNGFQYAAGIQWDNTRVDVSIFDEDVYDACGRGPRK
jgi:hypothetical protein